MVKHIIKLIYQILAILRILDFITRKYIIKNYDEYQFLFNNKGFKTSKLIFYDT